MLVLGRAGKLRNRTEQPLFYSGIRVKKLLVRFDPEQFRVRESPSEPVVPFEHEHEDEHEDDLRRGKRRSLTTALFRERLFSDEGRVFDLSLFSRRVFDLSLFSRPITRKVAFGPVI